MVQKEEILKFKQENYDEKTGKYKEDSLKIEDKWIINKLDKLVSEITNNIENYEDISQILSEFRDAVLPKLLSGEIEIPTEEEA